MLRRIAIALAVGLLAPPVSVLGIDVPAAERASTGLAAMPADVPFGGSTTVAIGGAGTATVSVSQPQVVTFHAADYDASCTVRPSDCSKPGQALAPVVVTTVTWTGVSGSVDIVGSFNYEYQEPDGQLDSTTLPLMTFEDFDPLTDHPTTVSAGQRTSGQIAFDASVPGGKVIIESVSGGTNSATFGS